MYWVVFAAFSVVDGIIASIRKKQMSLYYLIKVIEIHVVL
jgi:hypothetical protein